MKNINRSLIVIAGAAMVHLLGTSLLAQDWPQWRGPNRDGKAGGFTAPQVWPKELTKKWKVTVGDGVATPALVGSKLYVFSRQDGNEITRCLDAATGKELWTEQYQALGATGPAGSFSGPRSSPTVANGKVITVGVRGMISCLDADQGKKLWRKNDFQGGVPKFFTSSSPLVTDGLCIAQLGGNEGAIVAYDLVTGDQKWRWTGESPGYASPVLMNVGGTRLVVALTENRIVAVGAADGKLVWETPFTAKGMGGYNASTPLVDGQTLIYSGGGRGTKAVKIEKDGAGFTGKEIWSNPESSVQFNTPVLKDGLLYGLGQGNDFFCLKVQDGKTAWTRPVAPPGESAGGSGGGRRGGRGGGYGSIVDAGPVLMALTPSSELIVLEPNPKAYTELARIKVADSPTHAYPVVSGNRVFIKDKEALTLWTIE